MFDDAIIRDIELKEWQINDVLLSNITFINVTFEEVLFNTTTLVNCNFQDCRFKNLHFKDSYLENIDMANIEIELKSACLLSNASTGEVNLANITFNGTQFNAGLTNVSQLQGYLDGLSLEGCTKFEVLCKSDDFRIYRDSFFVSASALPGNIASAIAVYFMWRNVWLGKVINICTNIVCFVVVRKTFLYAICIMWFTF